MSTLNYSLAHNCVDATHRLVLCVYIVPVTFINLILLYFIKYNTIDNMKDYKMVLYATTIIDFISAWMQFLIGIRPTLENDMQTFNFDGVLPPLIGDWEIFKGGRLQFLALFETFSADFSFAFGVTPFIYRYFAVCWGHKLTGFQFFLLACCTGWLAAWSSVCYAIMSNVFYEQNSPGVLNDPQCLRSVSSWTSAQSESTLYGEITHWMFRGWFYGLAGILYSYGLVFFCGWRIYVNVGKQAFLFESKKTRSAQRQLTLTIGLQAIAPMLVTGSSLIFLYLGIKMEFHKGLSFVVLFYSFMVFPILNASISLTFISSYRKSFIDFCRWSCGMQMKYGGWRRAPNQTAISVLSAGRSLEHVPHRIGEQPNPNRRKSMFV